MTSKIRDLENAVSRLPHKQLNKFRAWFEEFDARQWDAQFEKDVQEGKLEILAEKALSDFSKGKCTEL